MRHSCKSPESYPDHAFLRTQVHEIPDTLFPVCLNVPLETRSSHPHVSGLSQRGHAVVWLALESRGS